MKTHSLQSYAKINICLNVTGKRADGLHELDMIMVPLKMHDSLIVKQIKHPDNLVTSDDFLVSQGRHNIVTRALEMFLEETKIDKKYRVDIHKVIPVQSGMGGGSSNAATILKFLNNVNGKPLSDDQIKEMGEKLGCDVPFFLNCKPARCQGIGDVINPIEIKNDYYVLIVKPFKGCSTTEVYEKCDSLALKTFDVESCIKALKEGNDELLAASMGNSLQEPAISIVPEIKYIVSLLKDDYKLPIVQMSGSGSAVFAMSTDLKLLKSVLKSLYKRNNCFAELTKVIK